MNGILNVYKEQGFTSHDVVAKLRGICKQRKIGHTGTLDPDAKGVLPVCFGNATKLCDILTDQGKTYEAVILFGITTDTQDYSGKILTSAMSEVTADKLNTIVKEFIGQQEQIPPMYSAIKMNGKKLYELARKGIEVERKARKIEVYSLDIMELINLDDESAYLQEAKIRVSCSKGTYIRTLCHDIGARLGCGACMKSLLRTQVGKFLVQDTLNLTQITELVQEGRLEDKLTKVEDFLLEYAAVQVKPLADKLLYNGNQLLVENLKEVSLDQKMESKIRVYDSKGVFTGIYSWDAKKCCFQPDKMFLK